MKVTVKVQYNDSMIIVEANPRLRDFESTTRRIVKQVQDSGIALGLLRRVEKNDTF